ncbi:MAG TPA: hypothetical protein VGD51_07915, partial [Nocardioidaceae bacterium]
MQDTTDGRRPSGPPTLSPHPRYLREAGREYLNVRVLDPLTAYQVVDQPATQPTAFVADSLLVRGFHEETLEALQAAATEAGFALVW